MATPIHVPQIKIFKLAAYHVTSDLEEAINKYVAEFYGKHGNIPEIKPNQDYVAVIGTVLIKI